MKKRAWLARIRAEKGLTQTDLAERVGVSNRTISKIESGERTPSGYVALRIANELGFPMEYFYHNGKEKVLQ